MYLRLIDHVWPQRCHLQRCDHKNAVDGSSENVWDCYSEKGYDCFGEEFSAHKAENEKKLKLEWHQLDQQAIKVIKAQRNKKKKKKNFNQGNSPV